MKCENCKHWEKSEYGNYGVCSEIIKHLDIYVIAGTDGGCVGSIETNHDFGCTAFQLKKREPKIHEQVTMDI